jgi:hypothetical protein
VTENDRRRRVVTHTHYKFRRIANCICSRNSTTPQREVYRDPGGATADTTRNPAAVAASRYGARYHGTFGRVASVKRQKNSRRISSDSPGIGIRITTHGAKPGVPYLKTRSSTSTASGANRTESGVKPVTLAGLVLIKLRRRPSNSVTPLSRPPAGLPRGSAEWQVLKNWRIETAPLCGGEN